MQNSFKLSAAYLGLGVCLSVAYCMTKEKKSLEENAMTDKREK